MSNVGVRITELNSINSNEITEFDVLPIVDLETDQTNKINVFQIGSFIMSNVAPTTGANLGNVANLYIGGGSSGFVLSTVDGLGNLAWVAPDTGPTGATGATGVAGPTGATGPIGATGEGLGVEQANVAPSLPTSATLWYDTVSGRLYVYYNDGITEQWVDAAPPVVGATGSQGATGAGATGATGLPGVVESNSAPVDTSVLWLNTNTPGTLGVGATGATGPAGAGGSPGGSNTQIQYNDGGAFSGSAEFTYDESTQVVTANNLAATSTFTLPIFADNTARSTTITSPTAGMMVFVTSGSQFQGYDGNAWVLLN
jgi:hypothetical protein